jgi:hypothetical protein
MPHVLNLLEGVGCVGVVLADQFAAIQQTLYSTLYENLHHGCHAFAKFFFAFA